MSRRIKGTGSIFWDSKNESWVWRGSYILPNGQKARKSLYADTKIHLKTRIDEFLKSVDNNIMITKSLTVNQWLDRWLNIFVKPTVRESTYYIYSDKMNYVRQYFGKNRLCDITSLQLQAFFNELVISGGNTFQGLSPTTVNTIRRYLKMACASAVDNGVIIKNPVTGTRPIKCKPPDIVVMDEYEVARFLDIAKKGDYIYQGVSNRGYLLHNEGTKYYIRSYFVLVHLALASGMRISEIKTIKWRDINFNKKKLKVWDQLKTDNSYRTISLDDNVLADLLDLKKYQEMYSELLGDKYKNVDGTVFTNTLGGHLNERNFRKRYFTKMLVEADAPDGFTIHSMRHTMATLMLKHGVNVKVISERLGHASVKFTLQTYAHVLETMEETAPLAWQNMLESVRGKVVNKSVDENK